MKKTIEITKSDLTSRDIVFKLLNDTYIDTNILCFSTGVKDIPDRWVWETRERRENGRKNVYTILLGEKILVVAVDMLNKKDADSLGLEKRHEHGWKVRLDNPNLVNIVKSVMQKVTLKLIQEPSR